MSLRPYQEKAIHNILKRRDEGVRRQLLSLSTGMGKTIIVANLPEHMPKGAQMHMIAHREELITQAAEKIAHWNPKLNIGIEMGNSYAPKDADVVVSSIQTLVNPERLHRFDPNNVAWLVVDECFVGSTLVDGKRIDSIREGDTVSAFDYNTRTLRQRAVTHVFKNPVGYVLLCVKVGKHSVVCTPNHPLYTRRGWVEARNVNKNDEVLVNDGELHHLQHNNSVGNIERRPKTKSAERWEPAVFQGRVQDVALQSDCLTHESPPCVCSNEGEQPYVEREVLGEDEEHSEGDRAQTTSEGRERERSLSAGVEVSNGSESANANCGSYQDEEGVRLSPPLQTGHRGRRPEVGYRSGWKQSLPFVETRAGQEEGESLAFVGVDSVEVLEPGSDGTFGGLCTDGYVYNLEVEGEHTYTANGLVVHNCHHATASTYVEVINYFLTNTNTTLVGVTATSQRADGVALASVFDEVVMHIGMMEGIQDGYLSDVHGFQLKTGVDISGVRVSKNDEGESGFNQKQLVSLINTPRRNELIVRTWMDRMWPRQTVAFTEDIQHAKDLAAAFQRQGIRAEAIWGKSKRHGEPNRAAKIAAFAAGEIQVLVNAQLLTEGFDMWQIEGIIIAAPTKSQSKFIQMVGRGTRLHEGIDNLIVWRNAGLLTDEHKQNVLVMDPVDNLGKHSLVTLPSLFGLSPKLDLNGMSATAVAAMVEKAKEMNPNADFSVMEDLGQFDAVIEKASMWELRFAEDTKDFSGLQWRKDGNGVFRLTFPGGFFRILGDITGKYDVQGKITFTENTKTVTKRYDQEHFKSLAEALTYSEQIIANKKSDVLRMLGRNARWLKDPVSGGQLKMLERMKIPADQIVRMTKGEANDKINEFLQRHRRR